MKNVSQHSQKNTSNNHISNYEALHNRLIDVKKVSLENNNFAVKNCKLFNKKLQN